MRPVLQALLLAERIYEDKTGKKIIAGTFNKLRFKQDGAKPKTVVVEGEERLLIPGGAQAGSPSVYISLTNIRRTVTCILRYVSLEDDKPLLQIEFKIKCEDPLQTVEIAIPMPSLPCIAGVHALELLCDDEPVGCHRVIVEEIKEHDNGDDSQA